MTIKSKVKEIQEKLKENKQALQEQHIAIQNDFETMAESLRSEIDGNENEIMKEKTTQK